MPLYKRRPFSLNENPIDLSPDELVFQVRFTKEIFRDYGEYLNRVNLYRQRDWTCKFTGKSNLTFEEALVSERKAIEKVQQFPEELVAPVLRDVQFSMLNLKDLVSMIAAKLQEHMLEGSELYGRKNNRIYPCKIVKVLMEEAADKTQYQVAWLDKEKNVTGSAVVEREDLIRKKLPFNRDVLKTFIKESTCRSVPWVIHDHLAVKHGISTKPPEEIRHKVFLEDGLVVAKRKRKKTEETDKKALRESKQKDSEKEDYHLEEIKYPIDDLLVIPSADDPDLDQRPPPSRDFNIPMDCVGDILMIWNFCSSFSRLLHLWPFSLDDFESALHHKDSNVMLIVESHSALLRSLLKYDESYLSATEKKKRKPKITLFTWTEFLCDFLEMVENAEFSSYMTTIKRGHYGLLQVSAKLGILRELVARVLETELIREKLDEYIEERQALAADNREKALAEGRKRREDKERKNVYNDDMQVDGGSNVKAGGTKSNESEKYDENKQNGFIQAIHNQPALNYSNGSRKNSTMKKFVTEQMADKKVTVGSLKHPHKKGVQKLMVDDSLETTEKKNLELRKENLAREMEKRIIRTNSLGKDRYHNRYWFFRHNPRIYIESSDSTLWGYYSTKDELDSFIGSLNRKGERERDLKKQMEYIYSKICLMMQKRLKDKVMVDEEADLRRSTRVRAPPRSNPALAFLKYSNKWKED